MKIALIGATGFVGAPVLGELLSRGHSVTVLARNPGKVAPQPNLTVVTADALDAAQVAKAVAGHDAVVSAYNPGWKEADLRRCRQDWQGLVHSHRHRRRTAGKEGRSTARNRPRNHKHRYHVHRQTDQWRQGSSNQG